MLNSVYSSSDEVMQKKFASSDSQSALPDDMPIQSSNTQTTANNSEKPSKAQSILSALGSVGPQGNNSFEFNADAGTTVSNAVGLVSNVAAVEGKTAQSKKESWNDGINTTMKATQLGANLGGAYGAAIGFIVGGAYSLAKGQDDYQKRVRRAAVDNENKKRSAKFQREYYQRLEEQQEEARALQLLQQRQMGLVNNYKI